jgi:hypothetical protein
MLLLGVVQAQAAGDVSLGSYDLLATEILTTTTASVTFSSLGDYASTYQHLQLRAVARTARTDVTVDAINIRFNSDTASNYSRHGLQGSTFTGAVTSFGVANETYASGPTTASATSGTDVFGAGVVDILDPFETTKYTTTRTLSGVRGGDSVIGLFSGSWRNTASLTSITLLGQSGNSFVSGSRFSLYGLRS